MNDKLIEGYLAYTSADELNISAVSDAPATTPTILITIGSGAAGGVVGVGISYTVQHGC